MSRLLRAVILVSALVSALVSGFGCTSTNGSSRAVADDPFAGDTEFDRSWLVVYRAPLYPPAMTRDAMDRVLQEHMEFLRSIDESGRLEIAAPLFDHMNSSLREVVLLKHDAFGNHEDVKALCDQDPAVRAGMLEAFVHTFNRSKSFGE